MLSCQKGFAEIKVAFSGKAAYRLDVGEKGANSFLELTMSPVKKKDNLRSKVEGEIRLAGQRSRFQRIFDHLPDPVLVLKPDYLVEEANLSFLNRFQKMADEVIGKPCYEVFHQFDEPCDRKGMTCPLPSVLETCQTAQVLQTLVNADGTLRYNEITMSPVCPPEVTKKRVIEVIKDITPRKQLEEALQSSEERTRKDKIFLETIVDGIQDHMMVIDLNYRIIEVNRALLADGGSEAGRSGGETLL